MVRPRMAVRRRTKAPSRLSWAGLTVAPWCLAIGLVASFVADAGQEAPIGATRMDLTDLAVGMPADLIPSSPSAGSGGFALPDHGGAIELAHLTVGDAVELEGTSDEIEPKLALKRDRAAFPAVERHGKGDPAVALRPTFDTHLRRAGSWEAYRWGEVTFGDDLEAAPESFAATDAELAAVDGGRLEPLPEGVTLTTVPSRAPASPASASGSTTPHVQDGSTPPVARAVSLASTTPAPSDATPVEIAAIPKFSRSGRSLVSTDAPVVGIAQYHPDYGALIEGVGSASEQRCLAEAVYFEARSEPEEGRAAVAQVVMNRVMSGLYPGSVCGVVFQNHRRRNACQFSFACEGHALRIAEGAAWADALRIAREVTEGSTYVSDVGGSTHYHADYVRPTWARQLTQTDVIGRHVFYKLKPGQT